LNETDVFEGGQLDKKEERRQDAHVVKGVK